VLDEASPIEISGNGAGCDSQAEVSQACANATDCPYGITLSSQSQIDAFPSIYPNCSDLPGDLFLNLQNSNITNLSALSQLGSIKGDLRILGGYNDLKNLHGLENLTTIGGDLNISSNTKLETLQGLDNLTSIGGTFQFWANSLLPDLAGLEKLTGIGGSLAILDNTKLKTLAELEQLSSIGGSVVISGNDQLENLTGLENLTALNGTLQMDDNPALVNLQGIENLASIAYNLRLESNTALADFTGLNGLTSIGGDFSLENNDALTSFEGLGNLLSIGGNFELESSDVLKNMAGLVKLTTVGGNLRIIQNAQLLNLLGLGNLDSIGGNLSIGDSYFPSGNAELLDLAGLENLHFIGGNLVVWDNASLVSLAGLDNVNLISGNLSIRYNPSLSMCSAWAVCKYLSAPQGTITFYTNAAGCNSQAQVSAGCDDTFSKVSGQIFADLNCNGSFDGQDAFSPHHLLTDASGGLPFAMTDANGYFERYIQPAAATAFSASALPGYSVFPASHEVLAGSAPLHFGNKNFRLCPDSAFHNLRANLSPFTPPRPGFSHQYLVCVQNAGVFQEAAKLTFDFFGASGDFASITDAAGGMVSGNSITWDLTGIPIFGSACFTITVEMLPGTPLGTLLYPRAKVELPGGANEVDYSDNFADLTQEVVGSFDPNDKSVDRQQVPFSETSESVELEYLIRFQNTGNFPATFIEVLDTL
ncbi:MAG: hypothetical protein AAB316_11355, partial [Bacteroidota bacterium]